MIAGILGVDLGTSSVKLLYGTPAGKRVLAREPYAAADRALWWQAFCRAARSIDLGGIRAVGLSSQVGTYLADDHPPIPWDAPFGAAELDEVLSRVSADVFLREIGMRHPRLISFPLPRLLAIKRRYPEVRRICMPKDFLCQMLTGNLVSDPYSWRGLAALSENSYSAALLRTFDLDEALLPPLCAPWHAAGTVTEHAAHETGIPAGTPVFVGCNDFFSALVGMGVCEQGDLFDVTGTSEHLGVLRTELPAHNDGMICGRYFFGNAHYGVTAASGRALRLAAQLANGEDTQIAPYLAHGAPLFLPYLSGERAPIFDPDARGVYFGIDAETGRAELAYAAEEGVVFGIYHIYLSMGSPAAGRMIVSGGAARNARLGALKAALFGVPVVVSSEEEASAFGAVLHAAAGLGLYPDLRAAMAANCRTAETILPSPVLAKKLSARFSRWLELYPTVKPLFKKERI